MTRLLLLTLALVMPFSTGCLSLASTSLNAKDIAYPVSMSKSIVDKSGKRYTPNESETVGHFVREWRRWEMAWGAIPLGGDASLTEILTEEIERAGGNGVINLTAEATVSWAAMITSLLLIFPESVKVKIEGDVIRTTNS